MNGDETTQLASRTLPFFAIVQFSLSLFKLYHFITSYSSLSSYMAHVVSSKQCKHLLLNGHLEGREQNRTVVLGGLFRR
jgi:hypothetical protein